MKNSEVIQKFELPFPPEITVEEVLSQSYRTNLRTNLRSLRTPNCFIIYRLAYIKQLKRFVNTKNISTTKISSHVCKSWVTETAEVKEEYRKLSKEVRNRVYQLQLKELYKS